MKRSVPCVLLALGAGLLAAAPAPAGEPQLGQVMKRAQQLRELTITEADEIKIGTAVSEKVRVRYGVVQNAAVHRYVGLVGTALAMDSSRPNLPWKFIVLDTGGVNAFAAPGGFIHITRGALGLMTSEAELAGVLAHEIQHVTEKHSIKAIQKGKVVQVGAQETLGDSKVFSKIVDATTEVVMAGFGRKEELEADRSAVRLSNTTGYSPAGLGTFLQRLADRNKSATEKQGLFASHPEMQERLDKLAAQMKAEKLLASATLDGRYGKSITYKTGAQAGVAEVAEGTSGLASGSQEQKPKKKGFGLSSLLKPTGGEKKSAEVTGSGASRGVDTERGAKGGPVSTLVSVSIKPADVAAFKAEGGLK